MEEVARNEPGNEIWEMNNYQLSAMAVQWMSESKVRKMNLISILLLNESWLRKKPCPDHISENSYFLEL